MGISALSGCGSSNQQASQTDSDKKVYKIGITQISDHPSLDNCRNGFIKGLENKGFKDGDNIKLEYVGAQDDMSKNTQIASNFAAENLDLVCGIATPSAQALYAACLDKKIPVIFNAVSDPVAAKLAESDTKPLPGISGISDKLPVEAQLKLIREVLPDAKKIGILYSTGEANSVSTLEDYKKLAPNYGFEIVEKGISKKADVPAAADIVLNEVDCISNMTDNTVVASLAIILDKASAKNIPVFGSEEEQVGNGCIASAGLDYFNLGIQAGEMAAKVLNGEDISTIPYETLTESKITVNKSVAEKLGISIPESVMSTADVK
ncbi:MAG: ABC transporter substrate-binding protein [Clostridiales bacterium]|nr:ABC transporter substrate-binding protein [Clostridiales bacterium]